MSICEEGNLAMPLLHQAQQSSECEIKLGTRVNCHTPQFFHLTFVETFLASHLSFFAFPTPPNPSGFARGGLVAFAQISALHAFPALKKSLRPNPWP